MEAKMSPNSNRLADKAKFTDRLLIHKKTILFTFAIDMIFASTTKFFFEKIIKNIKQHFKNLKRLSVSPTNQYLSNDTTLAKSNFFCVPVPFKFILNI
jgi:hypothetical protein